MDLINRLLDLIAVPVVLLFLLIVVPLVQLFKLFLSISSAIFSQDVAGKVVLITGASSGIGEHLAYEYAKRGAKLAIGARRENRLREVAENAHELGSPDVLVIRADVANIDDCKNLVVKTVEHFGKLDHLVNNAGVSQFCKFEDAENINDFKSLMDINFWGYVYLTHFAVPYLKKSKGTVIVLSSVASWLSPPYLSFYSASKAAANQFFETLRLELLSSDVKITIVTPGYVESEITQGKVLQKDGELRVDEDLRDVAVSIFPVGRVEDCAKAIVDGVCQGKKYITVPAWYKSTYLLKVLCPEVLDWCNKMLYTTSAGSSPNEAFSKKLLDFTGVKNVIYPDTIRKTAMQKEE